MTAHLTGIMLTLGVPLAIYAITATLCEGWERIVETIIAGLAVGREDGL